MQMEALSPLLLPTPSKKAKKSKSFQPFDSHSHHSHLHSTQSPSRQHRDSLGDRGRSQTQGASATTPRLLKKMNVAPFPVTISLVSIAMLFEPSSFHVSLEVCEL